MIRNYKLLYQNLNNVSFKLFSGLALIHIITGLLLAQGIATKSNWLINRVLDFPIFLLGLLYFGSLLRNQFPISSEGRFTLTDLVFWLSILILSTIIFLFDLFTLNTLPF